MKRSTLFFRSVVTVAFVAVLIHEAAGKNGPTPYQACIAYNVQLARLCECLMTSDSCTQMFDTFIRFKCPKVKALADAKSFYGSCLPKLRGATCSPPRRSLLDAPRSCADQFVEYAPGEETPNPWGEEDRRKPIKIATPKANEPRSPPDAGQPAKAAQVAARDGKPVEWDTCSLDDDEIPELPSSRMIETRIGGITPHLPDVIKLQHRGEVVSGSYKICVDCRGHVISAMVVNGIPGADAEIITDLKTWTFQPRQAMACFKESFQFTIG